MKISLNCWKPFMMQIIKRQFIFLLDHIWLSKSCRQPSKLTASLKTCYSRKKHLFLKLNLIIFLHNKLNATLFIYLLKPRDWVSPIVALVWLLGVCTVTDLVHITVEILFILLIWHLYFMKFQWYLCFKKLQNVSPHINVSAPLLNLLFSTCRTWSCSIFLGNFSHKNEFVWLGFFLLCIFTTVLSILNG